ncbi:chromosome segregation protein SMC [Sandaracinobacter sp. RS1-74]|uniref:chromosome segregation protein SMC n=1 Tax=Sandaracinobacteroides sayramensis TaxID=2913411 RepID=UPI001EDA678D|nr:chromosome segregation protein SMC [Sandaracinobacteroides sayramensis]MCG2840281.1 chromosome segregation protein SMC [Sandaracinobacteroides sayramensis]
MRFAKLRLSGFKSFVEPTELHIRDGLTGVVGPNGCGKSNLLEALRWVMGESSARSLRVAAGGAGMDDVIFAGTAKRPSRDLAEVRLTLDNSARRAPAEFNSDDSLEVSRAIVRGEGSSYSLNGREVRLKDVQLLFADAATGAHSPALVSQGRVAAIINAKPQERRQLLEEAAGISGLNVRRREAELRLRAADANLLRLDDVMKGAETQAAGLRRQAKSAARYRELSDRIRASESALLRLQWAAAVEAQQAAERDLQATDAALAEAVKAAARAATAKADAAAGLPAKRQAEANVAAVVQRLSTERATLVAERAGLVKRLQDLQAALDNAGADAERERARARDSAGTQARLAEELQGQRQAEAEAQAAVCPQAEEVRAAEAAATEAERALAGAVEAHAALVAEARSVRAQAEAARGRAERLRGERQRLEAELARLKASGSGATLDGQLAEAEAALAARMAEAEAAAGSIAAAERDAQAARQAAEAVERALSAARAEVASLEAEAAALERLRGAKQAQAAAGARASLSANPGFEAAAAAALGDDLNAALGAPEKPARHWLRIGVQKGDPALPPGCLPLAAEVQAPAELARRLAQVGVVDAPPDAATLAALRPGQRLVARNGWLWRWDGFVAPPGGQAAAVAEALAQDNRRKEIAANLLAPRERLKAAEAELAQQKAALADAQAAERKARATRSEAERAREQLAGRLQGLRAAQAQAAARTSAMEASIERLAAEGASAAEEAESATLAVTRLPDATAAAEQVGGARSAAERARAHLAQARAQAASTERSLAEASARIARLAREIADWQARDRDAASAAEALSARVEKLAAERTALIAEPEALDARLSLLDREIGAAEAQRSSAAEAVMAAELSQADLDKQARAAEAQVADGREARATRAARAEQLREKVAELVAEARERFGEPPHNLEAPAESQADALEQILASMRAERERIGIVNLRADIELAEIEAALAEQTRERSELETAINRLRGSIGTLNREGRARLMAAFQQVEAHFRELFVTLFGGGSAELQMIESDDPLEAGLEIRAQPPGKKLQSLSLLSGGEQALAAIALIFALFRTNPAPICVLDEVDAPLDDANVERFTRLLKHMAETTDTRFLIVTHNAVTMAAMHRLYGVTMGEPGVSQLVSVELKEAERLAAA